LELGRAFVFLPEMHINAQGLVS
jgi:hypothetical protein